MPRPRQLSFAATGLMGLVLVVGVVFAVDNLRRVGLRLGFDYDLNFWSEDYFMTSQLRLAAGRGLYGPLAEASSTVYAPGPALLQHALLSPWGLGTSLLAHRILAQVWQLAAVAAGAWLAVRLVAPATKARVAFCAGASGLALMACAYANPVVDALHPTNLESLVFAVSALALAALPRWPVVGRLAALVLLPAAAFYTKQTAGVAVAVALAIASLQLEAGRRRALSLVPIFAVVVAAWSIDLWSGGYFRIWGLELLAAHRYQSFKLWDLYGGAGRWFAPLLLFAVMGAREALRRRSARDDAWLRAALLPICYAPLALAALFKVMGGPNNIASLGFVTALVAVPAVLDLALRRRGTAWGLAAAGALLLQLLLWVPRRVVPTGADRERARAFCDWAAARMRCGERVWVGRGATCYGRGDGGPDGPVPFDRMTSVREVGEARRLGELALFERIRTAHYDVLLLHQADLTWLGADFWSVLNARYRLFHVTPEVIEGDYWVTGWQGYASRRVLFFERKEDAGRHRPDETSCASPPRR